MDKVSSNYRYYINGGHLSQPKIDAHAELLASLERITTLNPPVQTCSTGWTFSGLYAGPTSIAYLFYRLHTVYPDLQFRGQSLLDWVEAYLNLSTHVRKLSPSPNHCGIANETLAYETLRSILVKDASLVRKICLYGDVINIKVKGSSNEWLYGRAGYLYFLRLARSKFRDQDLAVVQQLDDTMRNTIRRILEEPQPWTWHGSQYMGAAHGVIGTICQVVLSDHASALELSDLLSDTIDHQYPSGNFPSSLPAGGDRLVQFCHGSPGFVLSLESIMSHFPVLKEKIEKAIELARQDVWNRGILTKAPSLCHGIAGNVLALSSESQIQHFLKYMTTEATQQRPGWMADMGHSDEFVSLYTGEAGRAWVWAVTHKELSRTCIGYNDL